MPRNARSTPAPARSTAPPISISIAAVREAARLSGTIGTKSGSGDAGIGERAGSQLPPPHVKLIAMQPVAQRDRARHRPRRQALRDNRRLLRRAPAPPPRRSRQNLNPPETVPINWQITWQTSLPASTERGRIIPSPSAPARWEQRSAYSTSWTPARDNRGVEVIQESSFPAPIAVCADTGRTACVARERGAV